MKFVTKESSEKLVHLRATIDGVDVICGGMIAATFKSDSDTLVIDERVLKKLGIIGRVRLLSEKNEDFVFANLDGTDATNA